MKNILKSYNNQSKVADYTSKKDGENACRNGPRLPVVQRLFFRVYNGVKAIYIQQTLYFKVWNLIFSWVSNMQCYIPEMLGSAKNIILPNKANASVLSVVKVDQAWLWCGLGDSHTFLPHNSFIWVYQGLIPSSVEEHLYRENGVCRDWVLVIDDKSIIDQTLLSLPWTLFQRGLTFGPSCSSLYCPILASILLLQLRVPCPQYWMWFPIFHHP